MARIRALTSLPATLPRPSPTVVSFMTIVPAIVDVPQTGRAADFRIAFHRGRWGRPLVYRQRPQAEVTADPLGRLVRAQFGPIGTGSGKKCKADGGSAKKDLKVPRRVLASLICAVACLLLLASLPFYLLVAPLVMGARSLEATK